MATIPEPRRGEVWLAQLDKIRPVVVLTRDPMGRYLNAVMVGPVTSTVRNVSTEVAVGPADGVRLASVVNLDNAQLLLRTARVRKVGSVRATTMQRMCEALEIATGCA